MTYTATRETLTHLATLVVQERPDWQHPVVLAVLESHTHQVAGTDLAIAALRTARDHDLPTPKAIGWRTKHWDGLATKPEKLRPGPKCDTCGKQEADCYTQRPGRDDDHVFDPVEVTR